MNNEKEHSIKSNLPSRVKVFVKDAAHEIAEAYTSSKENGIISALMSSSAVALKKSSPLIYMLGAYLLSGAGILGVYPFGVAFISSVGKYVFLSYAGAVLSALSGSEPVIDIAVYTMILCLRRIALYLTDNERTIDHFSDCARVRVAISAIGGATLGAYGCVMNGFDPESLVRFFAFVIMSSAVTVLFSGVLPVREDTTVFMRDVGRGAIITSVIISLHAVSVFSLSPAAIAAFIITIAVSHKKGMLRGTVLGLFLGMTESVALIPIYAIAGAVYGILRTVSSYAAVIASALSVVSWLVYVDSYSLALSMTPELLIGATVCLILSGTGVLSKKEAAAGQNFDILSSESNKIKSNEAELLISSEAQSFDELSEMMMRLSEHQRRPEFSDILRSVIDGRSRICKKCRQRHVCEDEMTDESDEAVSRLSSLIFHNGPAEDEDLPQFYKDNCIHTDELVASVNTSCAEMIRDRCEKDKTEVIAFDYNAVSMVLRDIIRQNDSVGTINETLSQELCASLSKARIKYGRAAVFGERAYTVFISDIKLGAFSISNRELCELAERVCGGKFSMPEFDLMGNEINAKMQQVRSISAKVECAKSTMTDSSATGDTAVWFECRGDRFCTVLSDGMGSGRQAAITSGVCVMFIEKMMSCGNSAAVTLKMLNSMIRSRGEECSSTIDLCELDLVASKAKFIKSGAAPSFIVRDGEIYKVNSRTLPLGVIGTLDAEQSSVDVMPGDIIVLLSDGVIEDDIGPGWLYSLLSEASDRRIADTASMIIQSADEHYKNKDDATVCVIRIASSSTV